LRAQTVDWGNVEELKRILVKNPNLNVNWKAEWGSGNSALIRACGDDCDSIVSILLAHPTIDVNLSNYNGETPFERACCKGHTSSVLLLLKDQRAKINELDNQGHTPLWFAAVNGRHAIIKLWIASGREIDLGTPGDGKTDAIGGRIHRSGDPA